MSDQEPGHRAVVVAEGVLVERRDQLARMADEARARARQAANMADRFISVPLSLLGWVGEVRGHWRWVCHTSDPDTLRTCNQVGRASTEFEAVNGLTGHVCRDHGGLPE